ncbi:MAG: hypothetical protein M0Q42_09045 [Xanthomonadales bacterium]|nr:hypothetical protein [Xanthomonadales bacterium]
MTALVAVFMVIAMVWLLVPGEHVARFHYAPVQATTPDPRPQLAGWIQQRWPRAEAAWRDSQDCPQDGAMLLEVKVRGSLLHLERVINGAVHEQARALGLATCTGMGMQVQGPGLLVWNWTVGRQHWSRPAE